MQSRSGTSSSTLGSTLERYRTSVSILKKGYVQESYRIDKIQRYDLCLLTMQDISSVDIAAYRDERLAESNPKTGQPISPATVRLELSLLSNVFDVAMIEWGLIDENPVKRIRKPKLPPGRARRLTPREDRLIRSYCVVHPNPELFSIYVLALTTAMRQGEILGLRWDDINLKSQVAHLTDTKNGHSRDVPLSIEARKAILRLGPRPEGRLFTYASSGLKTTWRSMTRKLGIQDLHFHDLRHEAISRLFELGTLDAMEVAAISGHRSMAMLKRYTHLKAKKLVKKLDAGKRVSRQQVMKHFIPYPAYLEKGHDFSLDSEMQRVLVTFPDFNSVQHPIISDCPLQIEEFAKAILCQKIAVTLADGTRLPEPETHPHLDDMRVTVYIDPLSKEHQPVTESPLSQQGTSQDAVTR
ncbi:site-specific integrase [Halomonas elongata]|uniref:site-specific integrase n=1 Tax=Halomonas elongata TaxID=2746 RepID=UPI00255ACE54|nr:site-specific integrase [Halomonas elongata]MDL4860756.1 site-specific integrase [Halomonas elongata]